MLLALLAAWVWLGPVVAAAEMRTISATGEYRMGDNDTRNDAKRLALLDAKRLALEQAGTYLVGVTEVKNLGVTRDEVRAYTAGIVEVTEQASRTALDGETTVVKVDVTVKVDTAVVAKQIEELRKNEQAKEELARANVESDRLRKELQAKTNELAALKGKAGAEAVVQQRQLVLARADANEILTKTWTVPAGPRDDIVKITGSLTPEEVARQRARVHEALRLDPNNALAHFKQGYLAHVEGDLDTAIREYRTTIKLTPNEPRPHLALGRALIAQGKRQQGAEEVYAYLLLSEKKPMNRTLAERAEHKLKQLQREGVRLPQSGRRPFSQRDTRALPGDRNFR